MIKYAVCIHNSSEGSAQLLIRKLDEETIEYKNPINKEWVQQDKFNSLADVIPGQPFNVNALLDAIDSDYELIAKISGICALFPTKIKYGDY